MRSPFRVRATREYIAALALALALSTTYQAGVVAWVAFWAFCGEGFIADNTAAIGSLGGA